MSRPLLVAIIAILSLTAGVRGSAAIFSPAAPGPPTSDSTLRVFGVVVLIVVLGLVASSQRFYRLQRNRVVAVLLGGGWIAVAIGFMLGPSGAQLVTESTLLEVRPLLMIGLGWIGAIIGLQARKEILRSVPRVLWIWLALDVGVAVALVGSISFVSFRLWFRQTELGWIFMPIVLMIASYVGWSGETRSLSAKRSAVFEHLSALIRGGSGLGAIVAIGLFGLLYSLVHRDPGGQMTLQTNLAVLGIIAPILLAFGVGVVGRYLLRQTGRDRPQMLVVFLGMVTLVAGVAAELECSPLFASMLTGIVIANLHGPRLRDFERFILSAEHTVAIIFAVLAGVLLEPGIGRWGWVIVAAVVAVRMVFKPLTMRRGMRAMAEKLPARSSMYVAPIRQSLVAIALAVSLVLAESSHLNRRLLTIIVLIGLFSEVLPMAAGIVGRSRWTPADGEEQAEAEEEEAPAASDSTRSGGGAI